MRYREKDQNMEFDGATCLRESEKAVLVSVGACEVWIPKALIHDDSEVYKADTSGVLVIPEWLAVEKGLV